jgi:hypothetical protein
MAGLSAVICSMFQTGICCLQIPTQAGHLFRFDRGHHSDLKPATYSDLIAARYTIGPNLSAQRENVPF